MDGFHGGMVFAQNKYWRKNMLILKEGTYIVQAELYAFQETTVKGDLINSKSTLTLETFGEWLNSCEAYLFVRDTTSGLFFNIPIKIRASATSDFSYMFKKLIEISGVGFIDDERGWFSVFDKLKDKIFELIVTYREIGPGVEIIYDVNNIE